MTDTGTGIKSVYGYDANGNRIIEGYYRIGSTPGSYQNAVISYDALNRVSEIRDVNADITYAYDANGNRREVKTVWVNVDRVGAVTYLTGGTAYGMTYTQDYWYTYDSMDRFITVKGTLENGAISVGNNGVGISYNARGDRKTATYGKNTVTGQDAHTESYDYTNDGDLKTVTIGGVLSASRKTDVLGRLIQSDEYPAAGGAAFQTRVLYYDLNDSRVTRESDTTLNNGTTYSNAITNTYTSNGVDQGVVMTSKSEQSQSGSSAQPVTTTNTNSYVWWNQAKTSSATVTGNDPNNANNNAWQSGNASYIYDVNGNLTEVDDTAIGRVLKYQTDSFGQVLTRKETNNGIKGAYRNFFYLNGHGVGDVGTDILSGQTDYAQQLAVDRQNASRAGQAMYTDITATPTTSVNATFDETYQAYNATSVGQSAGGYVVMAGDTLQSIAQAVWGDSALWYVLADANGLSAGSALIAGQSLIVPNTVTNVHNTSQVFKPYSATDALGNTQPTLPKEPQPPAPKQHGCGILGDIIALVVAVVVTYFTWQLTPGLNLFMRGATAAAAGDAAYQATEMAVGNQKNFNWTELGVSFIAGGISGQLGLMGASNPGRAIINGMANSAIRQGVNIAIGAQKKFDWLSIAVSGVMGGVSYVVGSTLNPVKADGSLTYAHGTPQAIAAAGLSGAAGALAGAATHAALTHDSFGKSLKAALPEAIGSTLGSMITEAMAPGVQDWADKQHEKAELAKVQASGNY